MDLNLLKTFLEVHQERHFGRAADNLYITPSAVSARIRQLEEQLEVKLFDRRRNDIQLTPAGERLLNHAKMLINAWENARYDIVAGVGAKSQFTILGVPSLWDTVLLPWTIKLRDTHPGLNLRIESLPSEMIWRRLQQSRADLGFLFEPHAGPELKIVESSYLQLIMVATEPLIEPEAAVGDGYVMVDWGASFATRHAALFPAVGVPSTWVSTGRVAFDLLLSRGGRACYLPEFMIKTAVRNKKLYKVKKAQPIRLPIYAAFPAWTERDAMIDELLRLD